MTCQHGIDGICAECDGFGQVPGIALGLPAPRTTAFAEVYELRERDANGLPWARRGIYDSFEAAALAATGDTGCWNRDIPGAWTCGDFIILCADAADAA